jgi:hypothetical protein
LAGLPRTGYEDFIAENRSGSMLRNGAGAIATVALGEPPTGKNFGGQAAGPKPIGVRFGRRMMFSK